MDILTMSKKDLQHGLSDLHLLIFFSLLLRCFRYYYFKYYEGHV